MKKKLATILCGCALLSGIGGFVEIISPETLQNVVHAASVRNYECSKCGAHWSGGPNSPLPKMACPQGGYHSWVSR